MQDFQQIDWDRAVEDDCRQLVRLAVREDLDRLHDWTTVALVGPDQRGRAAVVARSAGTVCGLRAAQLLVAEMAPATVWEASVADGQEVAAGTRLAVVSGSARTLLTAERPLLNFIGHLSGVATLTRQYVAAVAGTRARIYDTRKTTPGWRRLEKYAVRAGGGHNHRTGLFDAMLIKDNHLACGRANDAGAPFTPAEAVRRARQFIEQLGGDAGRSMLVEIEVDTLEQLADALPAGPDIVLLDNMPPQTLHAAVELRDRTAPQVELEASGGVTLSSVGRIAATGVERISAGALTHSAVWFDVGLDWDI